MIEGEDEESDEVDAENKNKTNDVEDTLSNADTEQLERELFSGLGKDGDKVEQQSSSVGVNKGIAKVLGMLRRAGFGGSPTTATALGVNAEFTEKKDGASSGDNENEVPATVSNVGAVSLSSESEQKDQADLNLNQKMTDVPLIARHVQLGLDSYIAQRKLIDDATLKHRLADLGDALHGKNKEQL